VYEREEAQGSQAPPSTLHSNVEPASDEENSTGPEPDAGAEEIVVSGGRSAHGTGAATPTVASR
jgi:hypothetical protein